MVAVPTEHCGRAFSGRNTVISGPKAALQGIETWGKFVADGGNEGRRHPLEAFTQRTEEGRREGCVQGGGLVDSGRVNLQRLLNARGGGGIGQLLVGKIGDNRRVEA